MTPDIVVKAFAVEKAVADWRREQDPFTDFFVFDEATYTQVKDMLQAGWTVEEVSDYYIDEYSND